MTIKRNRRVSQKGQEITATEEVLTHQSPLPLASEYETYGKVEPTAPQRILSMTEKNRDLFEKLSLQDMRNKFILQLIIIIGGLSVAAFCAFLGHQIAAGVIAVTSISAVFGLRLKRRILN